MNSQRCSECSKEFPCWRGESQCCYEMWQEEELARENYEREMREWERIYEKHPHGY